MSATPQALAAVTWIKNAREWDVQEARRFIDSAGVSVHMLASVVKFEARRKSGRKS